MLARSNRSAQTAVEYLLLTSFLLIASGLIFAYTTTNYQESANIGLAKGAVSGIVNVADQTYALGEGSVLFFEVESPPNMTEVRMDYVCKDDFHTQGQTECLTIDPDTINLDCCAAFSDDPANKICSTPEPFPPTQCTDLFSVDHQELTVKRSYVVFKIDVSSGPAEILKPAHSIIQIDERAKSQLLEQGRHEFKVESLSNGKVCIGLPSTSDNCGSPS